MQMKTAVKGRPQLSIRIEGELVIAESVEGIAKSMSLEELFHKLQPPACSTSEWVFPDGVKAVHSLPSSLIVVHQTPPRVWELQWISEDSQENHGPGTSYRQVQVALPYVILFAVFQNGKNGLDLSSWNECYFRNAPLKDLCSDELHYPALLNCSRFPSLVQEMRPMVWICTQHLDKSSMEKEKDPCVRLTRGMEILYQHLFHSGFNRSSEEHELSSWFTETVNAKVDPRLKSIKTWEAATAQNPLFALEVPWLPTGMSVAQLLERIRKLMGSPRTSHTAADLARCVFRHGKDHKNEP